MLTLLFSAIAPSALMGIAVGASIFALVCVSPLPLILGLMRWRKESRLWPGPMILCVAIWLIVAICAKAGIWTTISNWRFQNQIPDYTSVVDSLRRGAVPCSQTFSIVNVTNLPPHIRNIRAACCADGSVLVEFYENGSSNAGHTGYLFKEYPEMSVCAVEFTRLQQHVHLSHVTGNWYRLTD
jgi:hypothetical protein